MRRLVVVTAGLSQPSSTRLLADRLAEATDRALRLHDVQTQVDVVELREVAHAITDNMLTGFPSGGLVDAVEKVRAADAVIAVTPIFNASYSGLFKSFFDVLDEGVLEGKPVLVAATAGTARHSLTLDFAIRPLFAHLRASVVPTAVFAASEDFGGTHSGALSERVERAARELADRVLGRPEQAGTDPFASPTPFEELLRG
jgi:FMN reductase